MWTVSHSPQLSVYTTTRRLTNRREFPPEPAPAFQRVRVLHFQPLRFTAFLSSFFYWHSADKAVSASAWLTGMRAAFFLLLDSVLTFRHTPALVGRMSAKISES
ncbi:hypothetical protein T4C_8219 [Trichinella pseudospiralis]|uniref:Uncharacterized protein n=1 Tax=Trichinella pseudospiralis TaxID=6337 RepID=A0A0V1JND0_TRIPS|nr:hypothetical protein T4C_8219 [Trichinella pseudospiralis]